MRYADLVKTEQDLTSLDWRMSVATPDTSGSFPKATHGAGSETVYYKASCYDPFNGIFGHECVNELVASRLMDVLGIAHVRYSLIRARIEFEGKQYSTWINASQSYRHSNEAKQSFSQFFLQYATASETPLQLCDRMGWGMQARHMMLVDYLTINQDRHGANIEVLTLPDGTRRLAPVFDCGNSFVFSCYDVKYAIRSFDPLVDAMGVNFIGSKHLAQNLAKIPAPDGFVNPLLPEHRETIFRGLHDVLREYHLGKIWDIIWQRWCTYAHI